MVEETQSPRFSVLVVLDLGSHFFAAIIFDKLIASASLSRQKRPATLDGPIDEILKELA